MSVDFHGPGLWYATRATGLVTLLLLTASALLGILTAGRFASESWPRSLSPGPAPQHLAAGPGVPGPACRHHGGRHLHLHPAGRRVRAIRRGLQGALAEPRGGRLRPAAGAGRDQPGPQRIGYRAWRRVHWLAYACWPVAVAHGLGIGTDRGATWVIALSTACILAVLVTAAWRPISATRHGARDRARSASPPPMTTSRLPRLLAGIAAGATP